MTKDYASLGADGMELQTSGSAAPGKNCEKCRAQLEEISQKIADAFHLENTPFFLQAIYNDRDGVQVMEFAPRIAGGATYEIVRIVTGFDYLEASIKSFLHEPITVELHDDGKKYINGFVYMAPGIYDHVDGMEALLDAGEVVMYYPYSNAGKVISESLNTGNRLGSVMVCGDTYEEADAKLADVWNKVSVIDANGTDVSLWKRK